MTSAVTVMFSDDGEAAGFAVALARPGTGEESGAAYQADESQVYREDWAPVATVQTVILNGAVVPRGPEAWAPIGPGQPGDELDRIIRWQDVRAGDLVLLDDVLITAEQVDVVQKPWGDGTSFTAVDVFHRLDNGVLVSSERHGDRLTAVRCRVAGAPASAGVRFHPARDLDGDLLPCLEIGGDEHGGGAVQVYVYERDGILVVSVHYDTAAGGPWAFYDDGCVPTVIKAGDADPVWSALPGQARGTGPDPDRAVEAIRAIAAAYAAAGQPQPASQVSAALAQLVPPPSGRHVREPVPRDEQVAAAARYVAGKPVGEESPHP